MLELRVAKQNRALSYKALRWLQRFSCDQSGAIAVMFALVLGALCLFVGAGVDLGRWHHARQQTIAAMDAAVLAGGRVLQLDSSNVSGSISTAQKFYMENTRERLDLLSDTIAFAPADNNTSFKASGNAYIATPFLSFVHINSLPLLNTAGSEYSKAELAKGGESDGKVEISMILDVTGSMAGQKIEDLKVAAKDLVEIVLGSGQDNSRIAIVPYANAVNVGDFASQARGSISNGTCTSPGCLRYRFTNAVGQSRTHDISSCVSERTGANAFTDAPPSVTLLGRHYPSSGNPCLANTIIPLTKDKTSLGSAIGVLEASGSTGGHIGVAWGWYVLSPNWSSVFSGASAPGAYGAGKLQKIAILMSDGEYNSAYCNGVISKDSTAGSGSTADHINCNAPNGHSFVQATGLCTNMKSAGVTVYTVGFDIVGDQRARDLMSQCATSPSHTYIAADGAQLKQAFRDIALKISSLYLAH